MCHRNNRHGLTPYASKRFDKAIREFKQPRERRQRERHKFACLTMKNGSFAPFARASFHFYTLRIRSCPIRDVKWLWPAVHSIR